MSTTAALSFGLKTKLLLVREENKILAQHSKMKQFLALLFISIKTVMEGGRHYLPFTDETPAIDKGFFFFCLKLYAK